MNRKIIFIFVCAVVLTGCSNLQKNQIRNVEEVETVEITAVRESNTQEETNISDTLNGVKKEMVECYIDNSHFYDEKDGIDFCYFFDKKKYHIVVQDAYYTDDLTKCGEYFVEHSTDILEIRKYVLEHGLADDENLTYLCVKIQLTNKEDILTEFSISNLKPYSRIKDNRLVEYGLADAYVEPALIYSESWYDYSKKKSSKQAHFFDMQPGETTDVITMVYLIEKEKVTEDLYLTLNLGTPIYNGKFQCNFPPDDEDTKFLKINLREVSREL